jgi:transglutaminase-like putative cysteine protease
MVHVKTVLDILAMLTGLLGTAPLFPYLGRIPQFVFPAALAFVVFTAWKGFQPLRGWRATALTGVVFVYYALQFTRYNLVEPAANLLVVLLSIRLAGEKIPRNYLQIYALSLFALAASSAFSLSGAFLLYLTLLLLSIAVSLVLLTFFTVDRRLSLTRRGLRRVASVAATMPAVSVPLILLFFVILPRPQFPLWNFLAPSGDKVAGLSDRVEPGSAANVGEVATPVLRARSEKMSQSDLYWRGLVLNAPQGNAWVRTEIAEGESHPPKGVAMVRQTIFPEMTESPWLVALDIPWSVSGVRSDKSADIVFMKRRSSGGRLKYDTASTVRGAIEIKEGINREFYLKLPESISPLMLSLGRSIKNRGNSDSQRLALLEDYFSSAGLRYTTRDLPRSAHPLDEFLFEKKAGHCEFFASSFAVLLRSAGIPSRLVGGYYGGEYNDLGGYYLVTESMAHVWVEVFLEGTGWVRRDPSIFAVNFSRESEAKHQGLLAKTRLFVDSLSYFWNQAVISYDLDKQLHLAYATGSAIRNLSFPFGMRAVVPALLVAGLLLTGIFSRRRWRWGSREEGVVRKFLRMVGKRYPSISITPSTGLMELADKTGDPHVRRFADIRYGALYRDRRLTDRELALLKDIIRVFSATLGQERGNRRKVGTSH